METLLRKYWSGTISEEEKVQLLQLLDKQKIDIDHIDRYGDFLSENTTLNNPVRNKKFEGLLQHIHEQIRENERWKHNGFKSHWYWIAALMLITIGATIYFWIQPSKNMYSPNVYRQKTKNRIINVINDSVPSIRFYLPDSTIVQLQKNSAICYDGNYNKRKRDIYLTKGCARFYVTKNPKKPFSVIAKGLITTAIGTAFKVNNYHQDQTIIQLFHGKITVKGCLQNGKIFPLTYLSPGEVLNIKASGEYSLSEMSKPKMLNKSDSSFNKSDVPEIMKSLSFNKTPVAKILFHLSRLYHVEMQFNKKEVQDRWFTGSFDENQNLDQILSVICVSNNLTYSKEGKSITITPN